MTILTKGSANDLIEKLQNAVRDFTMQPQRPEPLTIKYSSTSSKANEVVDEKKHIKQDETIRPGGNRPS